MTDKENVENQDVELQENETDEEISEMKHDPKNAEAQSVASVDTAGDATGTAPKRSAAGGASDNTKKDPMPKTKAGMIAKMVGAMQGMNKQQINAAYGGMMKPQMSGTDPESFEGQPIAEEEQQEVIKVDVDFKDDLKALVNEEATLSDEFKQKAETIFEAAINSKIKNEIDRLEEKYNEELTAEVESTKADLVEKVDSYLNYVVEGWMEDNKLAIQNGLRTEIAEDFMGKLKDLFTESYITVPEDKVDMVDELADTVDELEKNLNESTEKGIQMAEELEGYKRDAIIRDASKDLAETQVEKLKGLAENVEFDNEETFAKKVAQLKESYFAKTVNSQESEIEEDSPVVETSDSMASYLNAIKKTQVK